MRSCPGALRATALVAACVALGVPLAHAQEEGLGQPASGEPGAARGDTYGTAATTNQVLQAYAFAPFAGASTNVFSNNFGSRYCTSPCSFEAPVRLPAGALIMGMELEACDTDATASVTAGLFRQTQLEGAFTPLASVGTGLSATPGCGFFNVTLAPTHTVNNETGSYVAQVSISGATSVVTRFQAVRLVYRLQVSAGPATATFPNDMPTSNPYFRFIEALAASGITGGCSPGSFCPNDPVTRGQMAVFLATALGLHFPN
jgi:S-layer family protein